MQSIPYVPRTTFKRWCAARHADFPAAGFAVRFARGRGTPRQPARIWTTDRQLGYRSRVILWAASNSMDADRPAFVKAAGELFDRWARGWDKE